MVGSSTSLSIIYDDDDDDDDDRSELTSIRPGWCTWTKDISTGDHSRWLGVKERFYLLKEAMHELRRKKKTRFVGEWEVEPLRAGRERRRSIWSYRAHVSELER